MAYFFCFRKHSNLVQLSKLFLKMHKLSMTCHSSNPPRPGGGGGGVDFLKFANMGGDEIFFLEMEGLDFYIKFS